MKTMNTLISRNYVERTINSFKFFLRRREMYPTMSTLTSWLEVYKSDLNLPKTVDINDLTNAIWENLGSWA